VRAALPELPAAKRARYADDLGLTAYDAATLTGSRETAAYFDAVSANLAQRLPGEDMRALAKTAANWVTGELAGALNRAELEIERAPVSPRQLGGLIARIHDRTISGKIAKEVFAAMWAGEGDADAIIQAKGLKQITDSGALEAIVDAILAANPEQVENYRAADAGKRPKMIGFFVGQVMKQTQGKANPQQVNALLKDKLEG
jgi:aspartyl-tRNA(Asn)/glutamyl-tRNA(Gln) amidotransferase subunit B